jgi:hypothetical protein
VRRLLPGNIEHRPSGGGHILSDLKEQGGLPYSRLARQQYNRARHDAAAEHPVEFLAGQHDALLAVQLQSGEFLDGF